MSAPRVPPPRTLFTLAGTPVQADLSAPLSPLGTFMLCWLLVRERYAGRAWLTRALISALWSGLFTSVYFVHSLGHIISARAASAPMDALIINALHWLTLYHNDSVPPQAHLGRASGGPLANLAAFLIALPLRTLLPEGPFGRDLLNVFAAFNVLIGSAALLPTPAFDGGTLLKWSVYQKTGNLEQAAQTVRQAGLGAAALLGAAGTAAVLLGRWLAGTGLAAISLFVTLDALRRD